MPVARGLALALAAALWLGAVPAARAQEAPPAGEVLVTLDFQDADITEVISTIAKATGKNFLYDDRVRGRVTVISPEPVTADEAYRVFESILAVKGFTTVPSPGGILKILPLRDAKENPIETVPANKVAEDRDTFITRLMPLRYVKADAISDTIKPLVSKDATVIPYGPTNTLIITDAAANIRRLTNIIDQIDVSTYQETIKLVPIQYADANQLVQQLQQIFGDDSGGAVPGQPGVRRARAVVQQPTPGVQGIPGSDQSGGASSNAPRFIADERTNAIVVIATKNVLREVERIITLLDYKRKGSGRIHVYRLRNADADEIAQTLSSLASGSPGASGAGGLGSRTGTQRTSLTGLGSSVNPAGSALGGGLGGLGSTGGASSSAVAELGEGVRVTADAPTNSLIIQASAEAYATLAEVIEALDTRRPQVMVEALIMEVNANPATTLGSAWLTTMATGDGSTLGAGSGNLASADDFANTTGLATGGASAAGFVTAFLGRTVSIPDPNNPGQFIQVPWIRALITASESNTDTNIISAPTILTADKKEAEIVVGQNIPVPTSKLQAAGTTTNPENPFQTSQSISRQDVGVTLRVTPQISEGDTVRLNVFQEISEVVPPAPGADTTLGPTTTNRKVENTVYVRDGEAVMIGGILSDVQHDNESKVPWLGDIPIIGWAFKGTHTDGRKINLLIVLTPRIVRDPQDLQRLTVESREKFKSASSPAIDLTDEEKEERRKALEAGIPLPIDPNPVRRELDNQDQRYPVESLPQLRQDAVEREKAREQEIEALKKKEASGSYLVQVAHFPTAEEAVALLQKLIKEGYDGTVLSQSEQGSTTHWVQLGPYSNEAKAQAVARDVNATMGLQSLVVVEP